MNDEDFIKHQQLWFRPLLARAFSSAALNGAADWKNYLFHYFSGGLTPSYICGIDANASISGVLDVASVTLQFAIRHSCSIEVQKIVVQLDDLHRDLTGWVSGSSGINLENQTQYFFDYVVDFMKTYNLASGNLKLSPFDQHAWDQMIWHHWSKKQQSFIVDDTDDESSPSNFVDGQTLVSTTRGGMLEYFRSRDDQAALLNTLTYKRLTAPLSEKEDITDAMYKEKFEHLLRELEQRRPSVGRLPSRPFRSDLIALGAVPAPLSSYKDNALNNIMKHFGPKKAPKPVIFTKWGLVKHEPVKSRNDSRYAKSRARKEIARKAIAPVYVNGEKIDDFWTFAGGDSCVVPGSDTLDFDIRPAKSKQATKHKIEASREAGGKQQITEPMFQSANQAENITEQPVVPVDELVEKDAHRVMREETEQYPGSETEDDAELLDDFGDSLAVLDETNIPWNASYSSDANKKAIDSKKPRGKTPLPEIPVAVKRLEPRNSKATRLDQEIARDVRSGFNALNFLSFALLRCAAWISKSEIWQSVHALLDSGAKYEFTDGQWTLRGVPTQPKRLPRTALPLLGQCYDADGHPLFLRKVFLVQPSTSSFSSV
ncbi:hypothetical protein RvY_00698 [Ramazzottius varieornatus]|uniref:Uncharacterized protein n=1 Tax=Ramazzottius varieornatus TaxID=947166 RepID=A0A1D1UJX1_RAMVA|nr:hypothetical protein RvY_00698 [Ramazzottius varieornatus]